MTDENLNPDTPRLTALADLVGCFTEHDMRLLADVRQSTLELWRKRGTGPAYIRAGNRFLYPQAGVVEWLTSRVHVREPRGALDL